MMAKLDDEKDARMVVHNDSLCSDCVGRIAMPLSQFAMGSQWVLIYKLKIEIYGTLVRLCLYTFES